MARVGLVVLDGLGIGAAPDAGAYGDLGSNTLGNVLAHAGSVDLPNLSALGLGRCTSLPGLSAEAASAAHGVARPASPGKDSTTGHWELCGLILDEPFPVYPNGFPPEVIDQFTSVTGWRAIGNKAASGTAILDELGEQHLETHALIVYTSADSVFQIAGHQDVIDVDELNRVAESIRASLVGEHGVSRVITRPFRGQPGQWIRTADRRDFSIPPPGPTLVDRLGEAGVPRVGIGKVDDLFAHRNLTSEHTATNAQAFDLIRARWREMDTGLLFANVIEFDQSWGHRQDVPGFLRGLQELDEALPSLLALPADDDVLILTADHGNDPTDDSTDHTREHVPVLVYGPRIRPVSVGIRETYADIGATVADYFGVEYREGTSFLSEVVA